MTSKQQLLELGNLMANQLDYHNELDRQVVQTGLSLYRLGTVFNVEWHGDNDLQGKVIDGQSVEAVMIDAQFLHLSSCTCGDSFCRHFVATFLAAYSQQLPVGDWLNDWKNKQRQPVPTFVKRSPYGQAMTSETFSDWIAHFEQQLATAPKKDINQTLRFVSHQLTPKLRATAPEDEALARWYMYSWHLFIYIKLSPAAREAVGFPYMLYYIEQQFDALFEELFAAHTLPTAAITHERRYLFRDLLDFGRQLLHFGHYSDAGSFAAYMTLIERFHKHRSFQTRELTRLLEMVDVPLATLAGFVIRAQHGETWHLFRLHDTFNMMPLAFMEPIIRWVLEQPASFIDRFMAYYIPYCTEDEPTKLLIGRLYNHYLETGDSKWLEAVCDAQPELAARPYRKFLLERQNFAKLAQLLIYSGVALDNMTKEERQALEKHQPQLLFPFYHSEILWAIEERKRDGYVEAVKLLKKLKTLYKKAKQQERFDAYFAIILERYKRLRSFMTLLREKKLL